MWYPVPGPLIRHFPPEPDYPIGKQRPPSANPQPTTTSPLHLFPVSLPVTPHSCLPPPAHLPHGLDLADDIRKAGVHVKEVLLLDQRRPVATCLADDLIC